MGGMYPVDRTGPTQPKPPNVKALTFTNAIADDAEELASLRNAVAADLELRFGCKSHTTTAKGVLFHMRQGQILVARRKGRIVGSLVLLRKKPWAIDVSYFTPAKQALYVVGMNVAPELQRKGVGRRLIRAAIDAAKLQGCDAIRLNAFDAEYGAGGFYLKCGFSARGRSVYRTVPLFNFEWRMP
jgi:GNAT superfamily N-acetyltransferase